MCVVSVIFCMDDGLSWQYYVCIDRCSKLNVVVRFIYSFNTLLKFLCCIALLTIFLQLNCVCACVYYGAVTIKCVVYH